MHETRQRRRQKGIFKAVNGERHTCLTNHFSVLENCMVGSTKDMLDSKAPQVTEETVSKPPTPKPADPTLSLTPSPTPPLTAKPDDSLYKLIHSTMFQRSTYIPIHVHTVDSNCPLAMKALIDTGATGQFINIEYVQANELWIYHLPRSLGVYNVNGTPNEAGRITEAGCITEAVDLIVKYKDHM